MDKFDVFKKGSTTYYTASLFFPPHKRHDIASLYAFVRIADDFVDSVPQDKRGFMEFKHDYFASESRHESIREFKRIEKAYGFKKEWAMAFLKSMEMDLYQTSYSTLHDLEIYLYGSSEVIGLCMNKILGIPDIADRYAQLLGKAMQLINFIRDIDEDITFGRVYIPQEDLHRFRIDTNAFLHKSADKDSMEQLIRFEIDRYRDWQRQAEEGYRHVPRRYRIAIKTAGDMYKWTAEQIYKNPFIVFERKVKPNKLLILFSGVKNCVIA